MGVWRVVCCPEPDYFAGAYQATTVNSGYQEALCRTTNAEIMATVRILTFVAMPGSGIRLRHTGFVRAF
jgi:hypothetical protein